jgi:hypothetical protein
MKRLSLAIAAVAMLAVEMSAQSGRVWTTVVPSESAKISVSIPAGGACRFGDELHNKWGLIGPASSVITISQVVRTAFAFADPDPGTPEHLECLHGSTDYAVTVTDSTRTPAVVTRFAISSSVMGWHPSSQ